MQSETKGPPTRQSGPWRPGAKRLENVFIMAAAFCCLVCTTRPTLQHARKKTTAGGQERGSCAWRRFGQGRAGQWLLPRRMGPWSGGASG